MARRLLIAGGDLDEMTPAWFNLEAPHRGAAVAAGRQ